MALCLPVAAAASASASRVSQPAYLGVVVGGDPGGAALLGGQQVAGAFLRGLRLAQRPAGGPRLLAQLAQLLADPGQLVAQLVGLHPGDRPVVLGTGGALLGVADLARRSAALSASARTASPAASISSRQPSGLAR